MQAKLKFAALVVAVAAGMFLYKVVYDKRKAEEPEDEE
jgi:hypothetical protein